MKALLTGCAGFVGSHLAARLLDDGFEVTGIDCLTDYYDVQLKVRNLDTLAGKKGFVHINRNLLEIDLDAYVSDVDFIFHLAAQPGVRSSWGQSFEVYAANNVLATQLLLESAKKSRRLKKFVFSSSSSVYGQTLVEKVSEEHPTKPFSPYGVTKLAAEHLCSLYAQNYHVPSLCLRLFTVYGPRQRPDMAFSKLIQSALVREKFMLYGDGTQERDFTYVDDVVEAAMRAIAVDNALGVFNIGGGHVVSMNEVINLLEHLVGTQIQVDRQPTQPGDVKRTSADISLAKKELGFQPRCSLEVGLRREVQYFVHRNAGQ